MLNLSLNKLKQISKMRRIKGHNNMSKESLLSVLRELESAKSKKNFDNAKIKKIREDFNKWRYEFSKSKIKKIRKHFYEIENKKNFSKSKIKEIEENLLELVESLSKLKKYYDYDDTKYIGIRDVKNLFNQSTDEDYYKTIKTTNGFDNKNSYIEYESKGDKNKNLSPKKYLDMIRPYLSDIINDQKTHEVWKVHSANKTIDYKTTLGEWKIQLSMKVNFVSSKDDSDEIHKMHTKSHNVEIMMGSETDEIIEELFESLLQNYQKGLEELMKGSELIFDSVDLLYYHLHKISLKRTGS